jgi:hypothetical protein
MIFYSHIRMGSSQTALRSASRGLPPPASSSCGCDLQRANRRREMAAGGFCGPLLGVKVYQKVLMFDALTPSGHGFRLPVMRRPGRRRRRRERRDLVLGSSFLFLLLFIGTKKLSVCLSHCLCFFECPHTASTRPGPSVIVSPCPLGWRHAESRLIVCPRARTLPPINSSL